MTAYCELCARYRPLIGSVCAECREIPGQSDLFAEWDPHAHARAGEPIELEAAEAIATRVGSQLAELLAVYRNGSRWTDREAGAQTTLPPDGWSKRAADLRELGLIERWIADDGELASRRDDLTGRRARLSRITEAGLEALARLS